MLRWSQPVRRGVAIVAVIAVLGGVGVLYSKHPPPAPPGARDGSADDDGAILPGPRDGSRHPLADSHVTAAAVDAAAALPDLRVRRELATPKYSRDVEETLSFVRRRAELAGLREIAPGSGLRGRGRGPALHFVHELSGVEFVWVREHSAGVDTRRDQRGVLAARTEVTWRSWEAIMPDRAAAPDASLADHPVTGVSIEDAMMFCARLGAELPTASAWRLAVTGGRPVESWPAWRVFTSYPYAWDNPTAGGKLHPVARCRPGPTGLFDALGNAAEMCIFSTDPLECRAMGGHVHQSLHQMCTSDDDGQKIYDMNAPFVGFRPVIDLAR